MKTTPITTEEIDEDDYYYCWAPLTIEDDFRISEDQRWTDLMRAGSVVSEDEFEARIDACIQRYDELKANMFLGQYDDEDDEDDEGGDHPDAAAQALFVLQRMNQFPPREPFIIIPAR